MQHVYGCSRLTIFFLTNGQHTVPPYITLYIVRNYSMLLSGVSSHGSPAIRSHILPSDEDVLVFSIPDRDFGLEFTLN